MSIQRTLLVIASPMVFSACVLAVGFNSLAAAPSGDSGRQAAEVDIACFARVVTSDPNRMTGTTASRIQEMPAEDVFLDTELRPERDGDYIVPAAADGRGSIGLRWHELRQLGRLELHWADAAAAPSADGVQLQYWVGESAWQGGWKPLPAKLEQSPGVWRWQIDDKDQPSRTVRVRWIFPAAKELPALKRFSAYSRVNWQWAEIRAMLDRPPERPLRIEVYNGSLRANNSQEEVLGLGWDGQHPAVFKVCLSEPQRHKADRTALRFKLPSRTISVAVEDVIAHDCVYVPEAGLFVSVNPQRLMKEEYLRRIAGRKRVLDVVRELPDQSFAQAMAITHNPVQDNGPMLLSLACDNRKYMVDRDGTLHFKLYDNADCAPTDSRELFAHPENFPLKLAPAFGGGKGKVARHLDGGWLPKPITTVADGEIAYRQCTYVAPLDLEAPQGAAGWFRLRAACVAEYRIENPSTTENEVALRLTLSTEDNKPIPKTSWKEDGAGWDVIIDGRLCARFAADGIAPLRLVQAGDGLLLQGKLPPGKSARLVACLPAWTIKPEQAAVLGNAGQLAARTKIYWWKQMSGAMQIEIPDKDLSNVIRASQVHCLLAARNEKRGQAIAPWIAAVVYGPAESEAQAVIRGMDLCGHTEFAGRSLEYFLRCYNPQGYMTTNYTLVGTGEHLWNMAEHYRRTGDRQWLERVAPTMAKACQWIVRQRAKTKRLDARGEKVPEYGLMPPGVSADWNRFAYRFFNDAQHCHGLETAAAALAEIGHPDAAALLADAKEYRTDLLRAFRWTQSRSPVVPLADGTWTPNHPSLLECFGNVDEFYPGEDGNRTWAYSVEVGGHHLAANRLLDPKSEEVGQMMDYLEDCHYFRCGYVDYRAENTRKDVFNFGGFSKLQPYYSRNAEIYAMRDEVKPFLRSYFNAMATLLSAENLSFWEHFHNSGAWNKTHETGWFLCQTTMMFALDRDDDLWLAPMIPSAWLADGKKIDVKNVPTRFGKASYSIVSSVAEGRIDAEIHPPTREAPKRLILRLRHPEGKPMRAVTVDGRPHTDFDPRRECIVLPATDRRINVRVEY